MLIFLAVAYSAALNAAV